MTKDGGPAFPVLETIYPDFASPPRLGSRSNGMSKRELYAMAAMQGILANSNINPLSHLPDIDGATIELTDFVALWAYKYADAMLARQETPDDD